MKNNNIKNKINNNDTYDIQFSNVSKNYYLLETDWKRLLALFSKKFKERHAKKVLDNISFNIKKGERVAIIGRNGSGKTTIVKIISNITKIDSGEIKINRKVFPILNSSIGNEQDFTGRENIYNTALLYGYSKKEFKKIEEKIIEFSEVNEYIDQQIKRYSAGMAAKLNFSVILNCEPEIWVVDEALATGDAVFVNKCFNVIEEKVKNNNITFVFISHSEVMASRFCNRAIYLKNGKIEYDGDVKKAFEMYNKDNKIIHKN